MAHQVTLRIHSSLKISMYFIKNLLWLVFFSSTLARAQDFDASNYPPKLPDLSAANKNVNKLFQKIVSKVPENEQRILLSNEGKLVLTAAMTINSNNRHYRGVSRDRAKVIYDSISVSEDRSTVCVRYHDNNNLTTEYVYSNGLMMATLSLYQDMCEETDAALFDVTKAAQKYTYLFR
ncbi:hypothetical protein [Glaciimonas soli]|uniref:Uncharacterized protein n=1 Tax=Glaciimonas soli TaxID=2590999 RepID=A0A843YLD3_9BURK|nr:hypothetical protein [Glaciimonas soli]MQR00235.1 hypothetical protein [Glaciimonas soli]